jgi:hypothetical protein
MRLRGGRRALGKRLTVFAAEDVGIQWLPAVAKAVVNSETLEADEAEQHLLRFRRTAKATGSRRPAGRVAVR